MAILLKSTEAYKYVFSTAAVYSEDIFTGLYVSFIRLGSSVVNAVSASIIIFMYLLLLVAKISVMAFPHILLTCQKVVIFHRTMLTSFDLLLEFSVIFTVMLFLILRKRIFNRWKLFEKSVAQRSKATADAAPHVAFFTFALILSIIGRKFIVHLTAPSLLPIITILIPICMTMTELNNVSSNIDNDFKAVLKRQNMTRRKLTQWVVLAAYHTAATGLSLVPFSARIASALPVGREVAAIVIIWVLLSHKFADIMFNASIPFLKYFSKSIPSSNFGTSGGTPFVSMLRMMKIVNAKYESILKSLMQEAVIVMIAIGFIFTPWRITYVGVIIISLLFPAFKSSNILMQRDLKNEEAKLFWLEYWICWGLMWMLRCYGFNIWPSIMLLTALWLQLSVFGGASLVFSFFGSNLVAIMDRHDRIQLEKGRTSLLTLAVENDADDISCDVHTLGKTNAKTTPVKAKRVNVAVSDDEFQVKKAVTSITTDVLTAVTGTVATINIIEGNDRNRSHIKEKLGSVEKKSITVDDACGGKKKKNV